MDLSESIGNLSYHAYAIVGAGNARAELLSFLEGKQGVIVRGNPDLFVQKYEVLTIDDARALKEAHATRPFASRDDKGGNGGAPPAGGGKKFFIIEIDSMTHEAQNALLKMFEEPNEYAHFFLILPSEELLLPTLRSRLFVVRPAINDKTGREGGKGGDLKADKNLADFLRGNRAERIALVDKLAADIFDGKKSKTDALEFCACLSRHLRKGGIEKNLKALVAISQAESYLRDRAPSIKQLLEYVALSV